MLVLILVGAGLMVAWVRSSGSFVQTAGIAAVAQATVTDQAITLSQCFTKALTASAVTPPSK